jgi:hypothetical protein
MLRTSGKASAAVGAAAVIASVLLLSACGNDSSTASSTPTLKTSTTTAAATPTATVPADEDSTTEAAPTTTKNEQPQTVQVTPTPVAPKLTAKDQAFLDALKSRGIAVTSPDIPLQIGTYICQANTSKAPAAEVLTYVSAMAGQDPDYNQNKIPITQLGQSYIDAANQTLCAK